MNIMTLADEFVLDVGRIQYEGAVAEDQEARILIIDTPMTAKGEAVENALALEFPVSADTTKLLAQFSKSNIIDPCDRDYLDDQFTRIVSGGYLLALAEFLDEQFDETVSYDWKQSYIYGRYAETPSKYHRFLFIHPTLENVSAGEIGKHIRFLRKHRDEYIDLSVSRI